MEELTYLENLSGGGTSLITLTIVNTPDALTNAIKKLTLEYNTATNIKSRI